MGHATWQGVSAPAAGKLQEERGPASTELDIGAQAQTLSTHGWKIGEGTLVPGTAPLT